MFLKREGKEGKEGRRFDFFSFSAFFLVSSFSLGFEDASSRNGHSFTYLRREKKGRNCAS